MSKSEVSSLWYECSCVGVFFIVLSMHAKGQGKDFLEGCIACTCGQQQQL